MPCIDCLQNCGGSPVSDQCVEYTGDPVPLLNICTGDQLSIVEAAVINSLLTALNGTGISPTGISLTTCPWLANQFVGQLPTLINYLQLLANGECSLYAMIVAINAQILGNQASFNTSCLTGLPTNPTPNQVLQSLLTAYCATQATVAALPTVYVQQSDLTSQVTTILTELGLIGGSVAIQYAQYIPIGVALPYFGSLAVFDNTGAGLPAAGFTGIYLMNGLNNTIDARGRTFVGAIANVPGGTLASAVDPTQPFNPNTNWSMGQAFGENYHTLTTTELASHSHGVVDPGHAHISLIPEDYKGAGTSGYAVLSTAPPTRTGTYSQATQTATTGISIQNSGTGSFHNNIQPSLATYWIIRMQ
jgi:microcystin-dependent protein